MTTVVLTAVIKDPDGRVRVRFADGSEREFGSLAMLRSVVLRRDQDVGLTQDLCLAYALARSADLSNVNSVANKSFIFDLSVAQPIKVQ